MAWWARTYGYTRLGQFAAAEADLAQLTRIEPTVVSTQVARARLAEARRRWRDAEDAWKVVLAQVPEHATALAGLAHAQKSRRPLSPRWMWSLAAAASADLSTHGGQLLAQVTEHRRGLVRSVVCLTLAISGLFASEIDAAVGLPAGVVVIPAFVAGVVATVVLWRLVPPRVRATIRANDQLTGSHRGPDWRRGVAGVVAAGAFVAWAPGTIHRDEPSCADLSGGCLPRESPGIPTPSFPTNPGVPSPSFLGPGPMPDPTLEPPTFAPPSLESPKASTR
jgi:hypothetical protein